MTKFELRRLESYDEASLLAEIRRVAKLIETPHIPQAEFNRLAKASSSMIRRRFGTWEKALDRAGLPHRYSGAPVSKKFLAEGRHAFTDEQLIQDLKDVALKIGDTPITMEIYNRHGGANAETIRRRFGSWWKALEKAGLEISNLGKRYSEGDYFENLLSVWTHYGRQPSYGEMDQPPSRIPPGAYEQSPPPSDRGRSPRHLAGPSLRSSPARPLPLLTLRREPSYTTRLRTPR